MTAVFHLPLPEGIGGPAPAVDVHQAAELAAEAIRALNHLSADSLRFPNDVHLILGSLDTLAARLPQALKQMSNFLYRQHEAGHLDADFGDYEGRTEDAMRDAHLTLGTAAVYAQQLQKALEHAQAAISGLSYTGPDDEIAAATGGDDA